MPEANTYATMSDFLKSNPLISKVIKEEGIHFMGSPVEKNINFASRSDLQNKISEQKSSQNQNITHTKKI